MVDDTTKLLLGPVLALVPVLVWELAIKPSRVRRNLALLLIAEIELNLEEIAYYVVVREEDVEGRLANMLLPRLSFVASQATLGELPPPDVRALIRFYSITAKIEATHVGMTSVFAELDRTTSEPERVELRKTLATGVRGIGALLDEAWTAGVDIRESLDELVRAGWMDAPATIKDAQTIRVAAKARRSALLGSL